MNKYKLNYSHEQKRKKLQKFHSIYYNGDPQNWKISRLPNWMSFYGNSLYMELNGKTPKYYRKFKQGTIVMIDYGVPIGTELGGKHFGVVLSNNDTKYKNKIIVIPLSSHYHKGYVDLGYNLMEEIYKLANKRIDELNKKVSSVLERLKHFNNEYGHRQFLFTQTDIDFLENHSVSTEPLKHNLTFDMTDDNKLLIEFINKIKKIDFWEKQKNLFEFVSYVETTSNFQQTINNEQKEASKSISQLNGLKEKLNKYNKQSFAVISDIKSISKLRVSKLNHYTISGNTHIAPDKIKILQYELFKILE